MASTRRDQDKGHKYLSDKQTQALAKAKVV